MGSGMPASTLSMSSSSFGAILAQMEDMILRPWSRTREVGPKQPVQGMLPAVHWQPQPLRVAGPMQTTPFARKQSSGFASNWCGRLNSVMLRFVGLDFLREHSSHRAMSGARTEPLGGSLSSRSAVMAALVRFGVGGQPGMY